MRRLGKYGIAMLPLLLALLLAACGGGAPAAPAGPPPTPTLEIGLGDATAGKVEYDKLCVACHGPTGEGVEGLGKPFTTSDFLRSHSDPEMLEFITNGRAIDDPLNTTGVLMPPKGGNPALTDEQILDIIAYIRTFEH